MRFVFNRKGKILGSVGKLPDAGGSIERQIPIEVAEPEECEQASAVVCVPDSWGSGEFTDNVHTTCADCGCAIHHRPHAPNRPPRICIDCFVKRREASL